jgi:hypothetical protein
MAANMGTYKISKRKLFHVANAVQISATNRWRFLSASKIDSDTHCTCCYQVEDILHCIWSCPKSRKVWNWVANPSKKQGKYNILVLGFHHFFLAEKLDKQNKIL